MDLTLKLKETTEKCNGLMNRSDKIGNLRKVATTSAELLNCIRLAEGSSHYIDFPLFGDERDGYAL